ncbi:low affinity immunoglobulin gamma Fc region receptor II-like [Enoplosus armatus]|uniref:low affinity immunoglobulin gamma Fc region receptor II-like n=1 Tax=Enoplosus armatus TaxID=215367 RepID=UPI003992DCB6
MRISVFYLSLRVFHTLASSDTKQEAALRVLPNRSQFFQYESVSLSCELQGNSSGWRVKRNTSSIIKESHMFWNRINESYYIFEDLYPSDTGVYWCESAAGECSEAVSITVTGGSVILESPGLPVMEGDDVTLRCTNRTPSSSSSLTADFYKDGLLIRSSSAGDMTLHGVSKSDEGLYRCSIPGSGASPDSWLTVRVSEPAGPDAPVMSVSILIRHIVVGTPYLLSTILLALIYRDKRRAPQLVAEDRSHRVVMEVE